MLMKVKKLLVSVNTKTRSHPTALASPSSCSGIATPSRDNKPMVKGITNGSAVLSCCSKPKV